MSDCVIGIVGKDYVLLAADATAAFSIILMKDNEDKILKLDDNKLLAASGEAGDRVQFTEYIQKNLSLYKFRNDRALSTHGAAHFLRGELATALRKNPYQVNMLLAGYDKEIGGSLYYVDYLASMQKVPFGAHGYGSYFVWSILDKYAHLDMDLDEGIDVLNKCIAEVQKRLLLSTPRFIVKVVDKNGTREVSLDNSERAKIQQDKMDA
ncbi:proteasome subunit beta-2 [Acrasis kona]|uniref:Proteasome subunit beta n=1 Tax=Acrasis kona TaxID=1008807 RepID=A0AAW2Z6Y8_9EUKA